jgi:hypothetical protein
MRKPIKKKYEVLPLCRIFPSVTEKEFSVLQNDIKQNGLIEPIVLYQGKVLDGRHRLSACECSGVKPRFQEYEGDDPLKFVLSKNLNRRHLSESQRAAIAAEIATLSPGVSKASKTKEGNPPITQPEAAETLNVSVRLVGDARRIKRESPSLFEDVKRGEKTVHAASSEIKKAQSNSDWAFTEPAKTGKDKAVLRREIKEWATGIRMKLDELHSLCGSDRDIRTYYVPAIDDLSYILFNKHILDK